MTRQAVVPAQRVQALFDSALAYHRNGRLAEAEGAYRQVIALSPDLPAPLANLGAVLRQMGQPEAAAASYRHSLRLRPADANTQTGLGHALADLGQLDEAVGCYEAALRLRPDLHEALVAQAGLFVRLGRLEAAEDRYRRALVLQPNAQPVVFALGGVLHRLGRTDAAAECYAQATGLAPDDADGRNDLGVAFDGQDRTEEAMACFRSAIRLRPDMASAHNNLAAGLLKLGRLDEAEAGFRQAIALQPGYPHACNNLGNVLRERVRMDEAIAAYRQAVALRPDYANAHNNLAMALLAKGDMPEGWREYEWRWQTETLAPGRRGFSQPQWFGEAAAGRTLLIHAEQGFGDTLQFCRYAILAAAAGLRVILQVPAPLVRLMRSLSCVERVFADGDDLPPFDLHCPMLSLPLAFGTTVATIPGGVPYLHADAAQVASWRDRLAAMQNQGPRVGLAWAGNPRTNVSALTAIDRRRSLPPERLAPLFDVPGLHYFSLQKVGSAAPAAFALTDCMPEMNDFADTAALIANLDLVISVDTAVAHLAAAIGTPVWLLDRFDSCWRWLIGRRDSPWYPNLRLYHQPAAGDWDTVLNAVARDLAGGAFRPTGAR